MFKTKISFLLLVISFLASCGWQDGAMTASADADRDYIDANFQKAEREIERMPDEPMGYVNLAMLYLKEARKTGEFALNAKANDAVARALELDPDNVPARKLEASLHLANHGFADAIAAAKKLQNEIPTDAFVYGVLADAYIETGEYERAIESAQKMVDLKPGTASYSRVAQVRSLHGDHRGAVEMFVAAAQAADPNDKETQSWCLVQLGDEYWKNGKYSDAERVYDEALQNYPGYFLALVSKGRVRASLGDLVTAEKLLTDAQRPVPNANATLLLGDIYAARGDLERASAYYTTFDEMQTRLGDAADHKRLVQSWADRGMTEKALEMARSEYAAEKSIYSADLLAWSLYKAGKPNEARQYSREALRLKTNDARMIFNAGMIAAAVGDRREARRLLTRAVELNPWFDPLRAKEAREALAKL